MNGPISGRRKRKLEMTRRKTQPLTADDLRSTKLKGPVALALERACRFSSSTEEPFSILDVGCGRGATVALLRRDGWNAFGAEIDLRQAELARSGMQAVGFDPRIIFDISPDGTINAADNQFDFLFSDNVVESPVKRFSCDLGFTNPGAS